MDDTTRVFGERLKLLMEEQGLSYRTLEAKTGIPFNTLNDYANSRVSIPLNRAKAIADAFGESLDWMAGFTHVRRIKKSLVEKISERWGIEYKAG